MLMTPGGQTGPFEHFDDHLGRQHLGGGRLPHHGVAHQGRCGGKVARDGGEVERRDGKDEAVQRSQLLGVPHAGRAARLLLHQSLGELNVVPPEVTELAHGIDFGLVGGLGLAQHGGGIDAVAEGAGHQVGRPKEDRGAVFEVEFRPSRPGAFGRFDGLLHMLRRGAVRPTDDPPVIVGRGHVHGRRGDRLSVDPQRNLRGLLGQGAQRFLQPRLLGGSRGVRRDGFVSGGRHLGSTVHGPVIGPAGRPGKAHIDRAGAIS
jgi:hypothetical protein